MDLAPAFTGLAAPTAGEPLVPGAGSSRSPHVKAAIGSLANGEPRARLWGLGTSLVLHLGIAAALLHAPVSQRAVERPGRVIVTLIEPPKEVRRTAPQAIAPAPPKPHDRQPVPAPQRPADLQPPPTQPHVPANVPVIASSAPLAPEVPAAPAVPPPAAAAAVPKPVALVEPRFDADYLNNPAPAYPGVSRRLGEQGRVLLRVHVDERGSPTEVALGTSSGHDRLDTVALETVRRWRFVPARRGEQTVDAWVIVPIVFSLRS